MPADILEQLAELSNRLGDPAADYVILGEGNSSALADADTFWVKASGTEMRTVRPEHFVQVRFEAVLDLLERGAVSDDEVKASLESARVDPAATARPSVETVLHAVALQQAGIRFVGHTHPTAVNAILCSSNAEQLIEGRVFPDEIVYCGLAPLYIPYTDPGVPLACAVRDGLGRYAKEWGGPPKVILMQNHGLIALGRNAAEVLNITAMSVKTARIVAGACALGGVHFLQPESARRIDTRPDEHYRRRAWQGNDGGQ